MLTHSREELQRYYLQLIGMTEPGPGALTIEECEPDLIVGVTQFGNAHLRPGGVVSGPNLFAVVDSIGFIMTVAHSPKGSNGFTSALAMQFLRPAPVGGIRVEGRLLKYGKRSCVVDALVYSSELDQPVAQGTVTYVPVLPNQTS
jgi:acyl-coenzyme A thioesterase PaaI-like protein